MSGLLGFVGGLGQGVAAAGKTWEKLTLDRMQEQRERNRMQLRRKWQIEDYNTQRENALEDKKNDREYAAGLLVAKQKREDENHQRDLEERREEAAAKNTAAIARDNAQIQAQYGAKQGLLNYIEKEGNKKYQQMLNEIEQSGLPEEEKERYRQALRDGRYGAPKKPAGSSASMMNVRQKALDFALKEWEAYQGTKEEDYANLTPEQIYDKRERFIQARAQKYLESIKTLP